MPEAPRKAIAMIRVSTPGQAKDERKGFARQREDIEDHRRRYDLVLAHDLFEVILSGSDVVNTKRFHDMLAMLKRPDIAGLIIPRIDRLTRDFRLSKQKLFQVFEESKKLLFCELGEMDMNDPNHCLLVSFAINRAGQEKISILDRLGDARERSMNAPDECVEKLPKGVMFQRYNERVNKGKFYYTPYAKDVILVAFRRILRGDTLFSVARDLGFTSPKTGVSVPALRYNLKNRWWLGEKTREYTITDREWDWIDEKWRKGKKQKHDKPIHLRTNLADKPELLIDGKAVPLKNWITEADFQRAQELLAINSKVHRKRRSHVEEFPYSEFLWCKCGSKMYHTAGVGGRKDKYVCRSRWAKGGCEEPRFDAATVNDAIALDAVLLLQDDAYVDDRIKEALDRERNDENRIAFEIAQKDVANLERQCARARKAILVSDDEELAHDLKRLNRQLAEAKERARALAGCVGGVSDEMVRISREAMKSDLAGFATKPLAERIDILRRYVTKITPHLNPVTDAITVSVQVKVGFPNLDVEPEPVKPAKQKKVKPVSEPLRGVLSPGTADEYRVPSIADEVVRLRRTATNSEKSSSRTSWTRGSSTSSCRSRSG